ncbi:ABC transporter substrate-binding protein [Acidobacteria bacterium AH-259-D05]|nr:ABC transporter substrate-binding protein [Acidobacteria bacterium AH-259-D05]
MLWPLIKNVMGLFGLSLVVLGFTLVIPAQEDLIPLRVEMLTRSINKLPFVIAEDQGLYRKHGLDVKQWMPPPEFEGGIEVAMERPEDPDISVDGGTPMMVALITSAQARHRIMLATTDCVVRWHIVAREGINSLEELKGKRLGVSGIGAMTGFVARLLGQRMGWDPIQDMSIMTDGRDFGSLQAGKVDAIVADETDYARARSAGYKALVDTRSWNESIAGSSVRVEPTWLENPRNRETARRFLKATVEAIALLQKDRELALHVMSKWHGIKDREVAEIIYAGGKEMSRKPYPCVEGIKKTMELFDSNEMRRYKQEDFYDDSLMREIDESGFIDSLYR